MLVREDQLSLAIGRRGQNVRLASKLCGWDIEIMTREELDQQIERAIMGFSSIEGLDEAVAEKLVGEGFLSYDDLSVIEPDDLMEMGGLSAEAVMFIVPTPIEPATPSRLPRSPRHDSPAAPSAAGALEPESDGSAAEPSGGATPAARASAASASAVALAIRSCSRCFRRSSAAAISAMAARLSASEAARAGPDRQGDGGRGRGRRPGRRGRASGWFGG